LEKWIYKEGLQSRGKRLGSLIQFFPNYFADDHFIERLSAFRKIFSKCLINHGLVTISSFIRPFTEIFENIRIKIYGNPGFTLSGRGHKYSDAPRWPRRPSRKAREASNTWRM
jgi:hypothetical protein